VQTPEARKKNLNTMEKTWARNVPEISLKKREKIRLKRDKHKMKVTKGGAGGMGSVTIKTTRETSLLPKSLRGSPPTERLKKGAKGKMKTKKKWGATGKKKISPLVSSRQAASSGKSPTEKVRE